MTRSRPASRHRIGGYALTIRSSIGSQREKRCFLPPDKFIVDLARLNDRD
jgi:hypothetical protein